MLAKDEFNRLARTELYLIDIVGSHFRDTGQLDVEDFWLILIWKANRAKNNERRRFESLGQCTFSEAVERIAQAVYAAPSAQAQLQVLMASWGMKLPMASAVLTILYPDDFTIYDIRVCDQLQSFHQLAWRGYSPKLWDDYSKFVEAVKEATPPGLTLRQRDHYLWGRSLMEQVRTDLAAPVRDRKLRKAAQSG